MTSGGKTAEELYREIVRNPDDDAPRLAYADAVASQTPERAEFIRLQIERFRDEAAREVLVGRPGAREAALRKQHGPDWGHVIAPHARGHRSDASSQGYKFERGFVALLRTDPDRIGSLGDQLLDLAPIQHLDLTREGPFTPALTAPCLGRMRTLSFVQLGLDDHDAIALAERGHLDRCEWLDLSGNHIGRRGAAALLANPVIRRIPVVILRGNPGDPAVLVSQDLEGNMLLEGLPADGAGAEARHGRIPWLHLPPTGLPDRFHARTARPVSSPESTSPVS
ncbi:MAG TPA: TIGR02996 domain-containing protein [Kofleriaceae bacterium]|nr:TIGR02996 domain-containing protein [Kofleriaceae bacterium]